MKRGKPAFIALLLSVVLTAGLISPGYSTEVYAEESASTQTEKSENTGISDDDQSEETGDSDEQDSAENFDDSSAENGQKISDNAGTGTAVDTNDTDSQSSDQTDNASANQTDDAATEGSTNKPGDAATEDSANKPDDAATADSANKSDDAATADSTNKSGDVATADSPDKSDDAATEDSAAKPVVPIIRRIISPITTPRRTYYFYDGDQLADQQTVKNGDTLLAPDCPDDQKAKRFLGWYEKDGGDFAEDSFNQHRSLAGAGCCRDKQAAAPCPDDFLLFVRPASSHMVLFLPCFWSSLLSGICQEHFCCQPISVSFRLPDVSVSSAILFQMSSCGMFGICRYRICGSCPVNRQTAFIAQ